MKFHLDRPVTAHVVRSYSQGLIRIGDRDIAASVIVTPSTLVEPWRPRRMAELVITDLEPVLALRPEVLLIGSGERQVFPASDLLAALYAARVGFEVMATGAACRTYNVLVAEGRDVAAALLIE